MFRTIRNRHVRAEVTKWRGFVTPGLALILQEEEERNKTKSTVSDEYADQEQKEGFCSKPGPLKRIMRKYCARFQCFLTIFAANIHMRDKDGIVEAAVGAKPREVLKKLAGATKLKRSCAKSCTSG
jgi:hypothetical protein